MKFETLKNKCKSEIRSSQGWTRFDDGTKNLFIACLGTNPKQHIHTTVGEVIEEICTAIDNWDIRNWESLVRPFKFADKYIGKYSIELTDKGWELVKNGVA